MAGRGALVAGFDENAAVACFAAAGTMLFKDLRSAASASPPSNQVEVRNDTSFNGSVLQS